MEPHLVCPRRAVQSLVLGILVVTAAATGPVPLTIAVHAAANLVAAYHFNEGAGTVLD